MHYFRRSVGGLTGDEVAHNPVQTAKPATSGNDTQDLGQRPLAEASISIEGTPALPASPHGTQSMGSFPTRVSSATHILSP